MFKEKGNIFWSTVIVSTFFHFGSAQSLSHVQLFATPWTAECQASLSFTISWSLLKVMSMESVIPSNHLILCHPLLLFPLIFLCIRVFSNESLFTLGDQSTGASASASVLPMHIQGWSPLGLIGLISLQSKGLSIVFFNTAVQKHQFFDAQPSLWSNFHIHTSVQLLSCVWLWNPMDCGTPGFPVLHHLLEFAQTHVYWVSDAI